MTKRFSKSKILSSLQCQKKLWLELNKLDKAQHDSSSEKNFRIGNQIGEIAQNIYDPSGQGEVIDPFESGFDEALQTTAHLLSGDKPIFEAAFATETGFVLADVMHRDSDSDDWQMVEIKSSSSVKNHHLADIAIQHYVTLQAGVKLEKVSLGHIDSSWVYKGDNDYHGLIKEADLTSAIVPIIVKVPAWFSSAQETSSRDVEPNISIGEHCESPYSCPFIEYCSKGLPQAKYPANWLPRISKRALKEYIRDNEVIEISDVPDSLLNEKQLRVKQATLSNQTYFDLDSAKRELKKYDYPYYFLDFETINPAIPIWAETRPFQQIPFQYSLHIEKESGAKLEHREYLDTSGQDPMPGFAFKLIKDCGDQGPIFVYNIGFEASRIRELAERFPELEQALLNIKERLVDLWPIAKDHYYNPSQHGSWSIKKVLPAVAPHLDYEQLDGVKDGGMAMDAFEEAISKNTEGKRKELLKEQLLNYCELDTLAMVELLYFFKTGENYTK